MQLDSVQNKITTSKTSSYIFVKGKSNSGKTISAINRAIFLKNNYCLYDNDRILIICSNNEKSNKLKSLFASMSMEAEGRYMTLLEPKVNVVDIMSLESILNKYNKFNAVTLKNKILYMKEALERIKNRYPQIKSYEDDKLKFLADEIGWIKSCKYNMEEYQNANRIKRNSSAKRLNKNSLGRKAIFKLMLKYNAILRKNKVIDEEDRILNAIKCLKNNSRLKFTHIIAEDIENYTRAEIRLIQTLSNEKKYSTVFFTFNKENISNANAWFIKNRKLSTISNGDKIKSFILKNVYNVKKTNSKINKNVIIQSMENFRYNDLKHNTSFDFVRDIDNKSEIILDDNIKYSKEDMNKIPVFNDIAAGEPIMINPEITDDFYMPKYWIKGTKDCFMLKIKGDSMINVDICDGDYVVIKKESMAQNKDIVAVDIDGSATLKRLNITKNKVLLMPENDKYKPIVINEEEGARIIGIALGVLKIK
ncbi:transcriptional repressor LexA [Clostridium guangxiense]|uniref:transcriptional repressor LexA n=1 Tax=Clostridium guangxiense TaxID=1662055 RepID=UPI001E3498D8|nr:transcriptional repressor LexA [Clostridium guangxiense]MCD2345976.1 transcriptional repressor LexA [Clostridium guangxiense]